MEIGSFLELQLPRGMEWHDGDEGIARLNSGRAAIWHAFRCTGCSALWLPLYQCGSVRDFLRRKGVPLKFYRQDASFTPLDLAPARDEAVLLANYFGIMSAGRMAGLAAPYAHAIVDNCQAFFCPPLEDCLNVYSARKFAGVPDGAYVLGKGAERFVGEYPRGCSSDTSLFLLQRVECGCEGKAYASRMENEHRLDAEACLGMSPLTRALLDGTDYARIRAKRRENFRLAARLFGAANRLDPLRHYDGSCVPMAYPLVVEDDGLLARLQAARHFQGHWWGYLLDEAPADSFEYWMSRYVVPITIDQRYGEEELEYIRKAAAL